MGIESIAKGYNATIAELIAAAIETNAGSVTVAPVMEDGDPPFCVVVAIGEDAAELRRMWDAYSEPDQVVEVEAPLPRPGEGG